MVGVDIPRELEVRRREASVPSSRWTVSRAARIRLPRGIGLSARWGQATWPWSPGTSIQMLTGTAPADLHVSPSRSTDVGSPIRIMSGRIDRAR